MRVSGVSDAIKASECFVCEVCLYLDEEESQDVITFDFPLDMTAEELVSVCGEPEDEIYHYESDDGTYISDEYRYKADAEKYYGYRYYEFNYVNGVLDTIYINYLP